MTALPNKAVLASIEKNRESAKKKLEKLEGERADRIKEHTDKINASFEAKMAEVKATIAWADDQLKNAKAAEAEATKDDPEYQEVRKTA